MQQVSADSQGLQPNYALFLPESVAGDKDGQLEALTLLVEDSPFDAELVNLALQGAGVKTKVILARDGDEAIKALDGIDAGNHPCPNVAILDINLPKKSGFEVLQRIRVSTKCAAIPVVILTSSTAVKDRNEAFRLGATAYLVKPFDLNASMEIGKQVRQLLET